MDQTALPKSVGVKELCLLLGLDARRIYQLCDEGIVIKVARGKYNLSASVNNYCQKLKDTAHTKNTGFDSKLKELKYEREKMEFEQAQGKLVDREKVRAEIMDLGGDLRSAVMAISDRAPSMLVGKDMAEIRKILRHECGESLRDFARANRLGSNS